MKRFILTLACSLALSVGAGEKGQLLLSDDFERNETDDSKEEIGNDWSTNSRSRAKGQKQVDLKDGAIHITRAEVADHGVSVVHEVAFRDATIRLRFKLRPQDDLGINIADMKEKSVHAGHICMARIRPKQVEIVDLKTGRMKKELHDARKAGKKLSAAQQQQMKGKSKFFKTDLAPNQWHQLEVRIEGDRMQVRINDQVVGAHSSPGIGHPTKSRLRLAVNKEAWVDDVKIWGSN